MASPPPPGGIPVTQTEPTRGIPVTFAAIMDASLPTLLGAGGVITVGYYVSSTTAAGGLLPVFELPVALTAQQVASIQAQLLPILYSILQSQVQQAKAS